MTLAATQKVRSSGQGGHIACDCSGPDYLAHLLLMPDARYKLLDLQGYASRLSAWYVRVEVFFESESVGSPNST